MTSIDANRYRGVLNELKKDVGYYSDRSDSTHLVGVMTEVLILLGMTLLDIAEQSRKEPRNDTTT